MLVVKADAYGHGLTRIATEATGAGVNWLGVASLAAAKKLRQEGVEARIFLLGSWLPDRAREVIDLEVTLAVSSLAQLKILDKAADGGDSTCQVHLRVDTGMGRGGCRPKDVQSLFKTAQTLERVNAEGIFSHLSTAHLDSKSAQEFTSEQINAFSGLTENLSASSSLPSLIHLGASPALVNYFKEVTKPPLNMVRVGELAYGVSTDLNKKWGGNIRQIARVETTVVSRYSLQSGDYLGYGANFQAKDFTEIALLPVGYAQGLDLSLSNRGTVAIDGNPAPIVGEICMNETAVDVTKLDSVQVGDSVEIIGDTITLTKMSDWTGSDECEVIVRLPR